MDRRTLTGPRLLICAWAFVLSLEGGALASPPPTVAEREAGLRELMDTERPVEARESAEALLLQAPDSFVAHQVLGWVFYEHETNFPRALFHLRHALELFEQSCGPEGGRCGPEAWRQRANTLIRLVHLSGDMDRREDELLWLDRYEATYSPRRWAARAWALMKLGRLEQARALAWGGIREATGHQLDAAWTALCAVESEAQRFSKAYEICRDAAERLSDEPSDGTVEYRNAGHSALTVYRFSEAERSYHEATRRPVAAYSNPWADLASLYTAQGRLAEAVSALGEARRYVRGRPPAYVFNDAARLDRQAGEVLLVLGQAQDACAVLRRASLAPDRLGGTSARAAQEQAATAVMLATAARAAARVLQAEAAVASWARRPSLWWRILGLRLEGWRARRRATAALVEDDLLESSTRPWHPRGLAITSWLTGELVDLLGAGVVSAALGRGSAQETRPGSDGYFAALRAETNLSAGALGSADDEAAAALADLPRAEVLVRARVALVRARAAARHSPDTTLALLDGLLHTDPALLVRSGVRLPVRLHDDGTAKARRLVELLAGAPLWREDPAGLKLEATAGGVCLYDAAGARHRCVQVDTTPDAAQPPASTPAAAATPTTLRAATSDPDPLRDAVIRFQRAAFTPQLDLSQADLRSLDGSTTSGDQRADELRGLIDRITD